MQTYLGVPYKLHMVSRFHSDSVHVPDIFLCLKAGRETRRMMSLPFRTRSSSSARIPTHPHTHHQYFCTPARLQVPCEACLPSGVAATPGGGRVRTGLRATRRPCVPRKRVRWVRRLLRDAASSGGSRDLWENVSAFDLSSFHIG